MTLPDKPRVLQVHNEYLARGGEDVVLDLEAELLRGHGHDVRRFTVSNRDIKKATVRTGVETVWSTRSYREVANALKTHSPDIVHVHNTFPILSPSIYWAARSIPVVQTLHNYRLTCVNAALLRDGRPCQDCVGRGISWPGVAHRCYRGSVVASGTIAAMQFAHRTLGTFKERVDAYITLTDFAKSVMVKSGLPEHLVHVKPNFAVDPQSETPAPQRARRGDQILFIGRLNYEKGVDLLLDSWGRLANETELVIVGDGPERKVLESLPGASGNVTWRGWLSRSEVMEEVLASRFLVLPSKWYEGFPMVVVEALSAGTPVIVPDHGGFPDIITHGDTGFLFYPNDGASLSRLLDEAINLDDEEWDRMSRAAREGYLARYTPEANYDTLIEVYNAAATQAKSRRQTS